jgi:hypothetical protein
LTKELIEEASTRRRVQRSDQSTLSSFEHQATSEYEGIAFARCPANRSSSRSKLDLFYFQFWPEHCDLHKKLKDLFAEFMQNFLELFSKELWPPPEDQHRHFGWLGREIERVFRQFDVLHNANPALTALHMQMVRVRNAIVSAF